MGFETRMNKILLIDDEDAFRAPILEFFRMDGFETLEADNGKDGLELALREKPDVILCDILMPGLNGYEVLAKLRDYGEFARVPFIFLSALTNPAEARRGKTLGADEYMTKPVYLMDLVKAVNAQLKKARDRAKGKDHRPADIRNDIALMLLCPSKTIDEKRARSGKSL